MKSIHLNFLVLTIAFLTFIPVAANAQENSSDIVLGGGLAYGEKLGELGLQFGGYYVLDENMRIGGDFIYWLVDSPPEGSVNYFEINANFNYLFYHEDDIALYGIGSLGIHSWSSSATFNGVSVSSSDTDLALGIGAGFEYNLDPIRIYVEPRFFLTGFDQLNLAFGVRYGL